MRWSRVAVPALVLCAATALAGCGTNDPTAAGAYDGGGASPTDHGTADSRDLRPLGEAIELGGFRVRVTVREVGGDEDGPWLVARMRVTNIGKKSMALPGLRLRCANAGTIGYETSGAMSLRPGRSRKVDVRLFVVSTGDDYYAPIQPCEGTASISVWATTGKPDYTESESDGWQVDADTLEQLNSRLPFTPPGGEPKDPDRPYAWTDGESGPEAYQVVSVPGMTAAEALRILEPIRQVRSPDALRRVVIDELDGGVVLFTHWFVSDDHLRRLSRGGLAASYSISINADTHIFVARNGRVIRSFDPLIAHNYLKTKPLAEEEGLDLKYDTGPASWTLLERLTKIHIPESWIYDDHPAYLLR